jgi:hypothetical protein
VHQADLLKLLEDTLDDETAARLAAVDRVELRKALSAWLPDDEVERIVARLDALAIARPAHAR